MQVKIQETKEFSFQGFTLKVTFAKPETTFDCDRMTWLADVVDAAGNIDKMFNAYDINNLCYQVQSYFLTKEGLTLQPFAIFTCVEHVRNSLNCYISQAKYHAQYPDRNPVQTVANKIYVERLGDEDWAKNGHKHPCLY